MVEVEGRVRDGVTVPEQDEDRQPHAAEAGAAAPESDRAITVVVVDDHQMMAEGLRAALATAPDIEVVGLAATGDEADEVAGREHPDVVLMDYSLPATDGFAVTRRLRELDPDVKVIMLTGHQDTSLVARAVEEGFDGFLRKTASVDEVIGAVRQVHGGAPVFSAHDLTLVMQRVRTTGRPAHDLTEREYEVLRLMAAGTSTDGMAEALFVSAHTVRSHVRHILEKLGAHSKLEAVAIALREGIVDVNGT